MDVQPKRETGSGSPARTSGITFRGKRVDVVLIDDAKEAYQHLIALVAEEQQRDLTKSDHQILLRSIQEKLTLLKVNPEYGVRVAKQKIPREYLRKYEITNLRKVNLAGAWRMLYTIRSNEIEILSIIFDILNHRDYEKKFGYRKS